MKAYEVWRDKDTKTELLILSQNKDGSIKVTFNLNTPFPKRTYNYQMKYLEEYYEYSYNINWIND